MTTLTPNKLGLTFHHLGLAVKRPEQAETFLSALGYTIGSFVYDPEQNVHLNLCERPGVPTVEIIFPGKVPGRSINC